VGTFVPTRIYSFDCLLNFISDLKTLFRPVGRVTFFACTKKVTKEMHPGSLACGSPHIFNLVYAPAPFGIPASSRLNSPSRRICAAKASMLGKLQGG